MQVLVTGATGFIGSHTAVALARAGHHVRVLVRSPDKLHRVMARYNVSFEDVVIGDVTDADSVAGALAGCDAVIHTAAFVSTSKKDAQKVIDTNVSGTKNVVGQAVEMGLKQIIHVSSTTAIYDPKASVLTGREEPAQAKSAYGQSKAACEVFIRELQAQGQPVSICYPAAVIGPNDPGFTEPHDALKIFLTKTGVVTSTGLQMVDVRDVAELLVTMLEKLAQPERITAGGVYHPWGELITALEKITGRKLIRLPIPAPVLRVLGYLGDAFMKLGGPFTPINTEAIQYATQWVCTDDSRFRSLMGRDFRDGEQTLRDTLISLQRDGHLSAKQIGQLADAGATNG